MTKLRIGIFFGGKSTEHEVSLSSAKNVLAALDTERFEPVLIGIDKTGRWHLGDETMLEAGQLATYQAEAGISLLPGGHGRFGGLDQSIDVAFPVLHGPGGEDGSIQGIFELADLPYVGPGVLGSAVGMDKEIMKRLLAQAGIAITQYVSLTSSQLADPAALTDQLGLPLFVKPANMGSSVGVSKVTRPEELRSAIEQAFRFDRKILVEAAVDGDEIECAVLGNDQPEASKIGRITATTFYSYDAKYLSDDEASLEIPAALPIEHEQAAQQLALAAYTALACEGMARVDMFLKADGSIVVNEINTIPGFTNISMYPKLWEVSGLAYSDLISRLIELAQERHAKRAQLQTDYR